MNVLYLGMGYCARAFHAAHGHAFSSHTASWREASQPLPLGVMPRAIGPDLARAMAEADLWLLSAPPQESGDPFLGLARQAIKTGKHLIYLSTVGVYGDRCGAWVDETCAPNPQSRRSQWRLQAEQDWAALGHEARARLAILRLPAIYGPGRNVLEQIRAGTARRIIKPEQVFNRIHVADIAAAVMMVAKSGVTGIFNIADDEPSPPQDVLVYAARLMAVPPPPEEAFEHCELSPMARSFFAENKRISNGLMKKNLGLSPGYPTYREGLEALWSMRNASAYKAWPDYQ